MSSTQFQWERFSRMFHGFSQHFCHPSWHQNAPRKTPKWSCCSCWAPIPTSARLSRENFCYENLWRCWLFQVGSSSIHREHICENMWTYIICFTYILWRYDYFWWSSYLLNRENNAYPSNYVVKMTISSNHGQAGFRSQERALNDTII